MDDVSVMRILVERSQREGSCRTWIGSKWKKGYGRLQIGASNKEPIYRGQKHWPVHRLSYLLFRGSIPDGMQVCHSCDNRACINPEHLWLGTNVDNHKDKAKKGRSARGGSHPMAKLNEKQVSDIRLWYKSGKYTRDNLTSIFPVSRSMINKILSNTYWKHLVATHSP